MQNSDVIAVLGKTELTEAELITVVGGFNDATNEMSAYPSAGWVCTISGECNGTGQSCNPF